MRQAGPLLRRMRADTAGSVAVEFALVAGAVVAMMLAMVEAGRMIQAKSSLDFAIDRAARVVLRDKDAATGEIFSVLRDGFKRVAPDDLILKMSSTTSGGENFVKMEAVYQYDFMLPVVPVRSFEMTATRYVPS